VNASVSAATTIWDSRSILRSSRFATAARRWGSAAARSHLVSGHTTEHHELEHELAVFVGRPRALAFSTGYMANLAIGAVLLRRGDRILEDRLNHASLIDAGLASGARFARYAHGDVTDLRRRLARGTAGRTVVATDGVFSMDGDIAPLRELATACREGDAELVIDDAHGFGINGPDGRGSVAATGLGVEDVPVLMTLARHRHVRCLRRGWRRADRKPGATWPHVYIYTSVAARGSGGDSGRPRIVRDEAGGATACVRTWSSFATARASSPRRRRRARRSSRSFR
jgi:hypothetical protein